MVHRSLILGKQQQVTWTVTHHE